MERLFKGGDKIGIFTELYCFGKILKIFFYILLFDIAGILIRLAIGLAGKALN